VYGCRHHPLERRSAAAVARASLRKNKGENSEMYKIRPTNVLSFGVHPSIFPMMVVALLG